MCIICMMNKLKQFIKDNFIFCLFFIGMVIYYAHNMFVIKPWYDELYTYYSFISRGPVYAAIHWPVPNNHVFYSVLSAFLDYLGNPYIGLRGISFLAASANLILLYRFAGRFMDKYLAAGAVFLYAAIWQVNNLSVQGRGYTISITFYLLALLFMEKICREQASKWDYAVYACSLTGGLYALISSTFWVIPVCLTGGIVLLFKKKYKTMWKLIAASLVAACMTLFLYTLIWLAIGSNLMSKDPANAYFGVYQVTIILKTPFEALRTGMEYMLATPYIQGDERSYIIKELFNYLTSVFDLFYSQLGSILTVVCGVIGVFAVVSAVKNRLTDYRKWYFAVYLAVAVVMVPVMLIIQSVQPYYRVFTFLGVPVSLLLCWALYMIIDRTGQKKDIIVKVCCFLLLVVSVGTLMGESYNSQYAGRETEIAQILESEAEDIDTMFLVDDYQKYVIKFYYDLLPQEVSMQEAEYVLLPKELYDETYEVPVWPTMYTHESFDFKYLNENFGMIKESESYELYKRL